MQPRARIIGLGSYLPERVLSNADLEKMVDTTDEWIYQRTGVKERRIAAPDECTSHLGASAARRALDSAGLAPADIDLILVATITPDFLVSNTASLIQQELDAPQAAAVDLQAACSGHIYGLSTAKAFIESGIYKNILVISSEKMSALVDYTDRRTCILFGDGAGAAVVSHQGPGFLLEDLSLGADGSQSDLLRIPAGGAHMPTTAETVAEGLHYVDMKGQAVFKHAVRRMALAITECLEKANAKPEDISWVVPHQANRRIIDATVKHVGMSPERVFADPVERYGNNSAASVGIAFDELLQEHPVNDGDKILMVAFGAGFTWGAMLVTKIGE